MEYSKNQHAIMTRAIHKYLGDLDNALAREVSRENQDEVKRLSDECREAFDLYEIVRCKALKD